MLSRISPKFSRADVIQDEYCFSTASKRIVAADRLPVGANLLRHRLDRRHERIPVGEEVEAQPVWVHGAHRLGHWPRDGGANPRLSERAIEAEIDLGQSRHRCEALVVLRTVDAESADVVERSLLEAEEILAVDELAVRRVLADVADDGLVKAGRGRLDHLHAGDEFAMLLRRHLARDEDAEVADAVMQRVDDRLPVGDDLARRRRKDRGPSPAPAAAG